MPNSSPPVTSSKTAPTVRLQVRGTRSRTVKERTGCSPRGGRRRDDGQQGAAVVNPVHRRAFVSQLCCGSATGESAILSNGATTLIDAIVAKADDGWEAHTGNSSDGNPGAQG